MKLYVINVPMDIDWVKVENSKQNKNSDGCKSKGLEENFVYE